MSKVWEWKETYGNKITNQIRHMGSSVDWSREAFTMDTNLSKAVLEAFCRWVGGLVGRTSISVGQGIHHSVRLSGRG